MSSLVTSAALVNNEENNNMENNQPSTSRRKNLTYKNKESTKKLSKNMLENLYQQNDDNDDNGEAKNLGDFNPIQTPVQKPLHNISPQTSTSQVNWGPDDQPIASQNAYAALDSTVGADYYRQYNNNYNNIHKPSTPSGNQTSELLKKLDNILYLLEEQREEQTNLITEELILYIFLGIFIIYVLDSFVRAGKYVR